MKVNYWILTLIVCFLLLGATQGNAQALHFINPKIGMSMSTFEWDKSIFNQNYETGRRTGLTFGMGFEYVKGKNYATVVEVLYSQLGAKDKELVSGAEVKYTMNSITLPVYAKFTIWKGINLQLGPQFTFIPSGKYRITNYEDNFNYLYGWKETNDIENLRKYDVGLTGGIGYDSPNGLNVSFRAYKGFLSMQKEKGGGIGYRNGLNFSLMIGWRFANN